MSTTIHLYRIDPPAYPDPIEVPMDLWDWSLAGGRDFAALLGTSLRIKHPDPAPDLEEPYEYFRPVDAEAWRQAINHRADFLSDRKGSLASEYSEFWRRRFSLLMDLIGADLDLWIRISS